jgi:hypothetical protein
MENILRSMVYFLVRDFQFVVNNWQPDIQSAPIVFCKSETTADIPCDVDTFKKSNVVGKIWFFFDAKIVKWVP